MKKNLSFLILVVLFVTSYASASEKTICVATDAEVANGFVYLLNNIKPFSGNDLCKYKSGKIKIKERLFMEGTLVSKLTGMKMVRRS